MDQMYFQKGFGLRADVLPRLNENYQSRIVDLMRANDYRFDAGGLRFLLAREFGFCYGVERAVEYAYETVTKFPNHRIFLTGEIIHNPGVNESLRRMGIRFLQDGPAKYDQILRDDVLLIPAFGVPAADMALLAQKGCIVVDTTCGSVLNVWKNVERYARAGITSVIHGKFEHEETIATFSRTTLFDHAHYLVVRDKAEAAYVCRYIADGGNSSDFIDRFHKALSKNFHPDLHLDRIGLANQTTMLSSDSLEIAEMLRGAMAKRYGDDEMKTRFHSFDTICSATQDRQDAVGRLAKEKPDLMIVIGGYNSSNSKNLARIAATFATTYQIQDAASILSADEIRHKPLQAQDEVVTQGWLPPGAMRIGIAAGASTPDIQIGETIERIINFRGRMNSELEGVH